MSPSNSQITDEMMAAARHAFHEAIERQVPGSWSYAMRFDGAMFAALEAALQVSPRPEVSMLAEGWASDPDWQGA